VEIEVLGDNVLQCHFVHKKIIHDLTWAPNRAAALGSRRLTTRAKTRSFDGYSDSLEINNLPENK
jgi:hypothetical protein